MNVIDPYSQLRIEIFFLKSQKKALQLKKLIGFASQSEINEITKKIRDKEEHLRKLSFMGVHF